MAALTRFRNLQARMEHDSTLFCVHPGASSEIEVSNQSPWGPGSQPNSNDADLWCFIGRALRARLGTVGASK
eukprot:15462046-Alexandrium_andersonii.AAC.1